MSIKDDVFEFIKKHGPQTNADLLKKFKIKAASMRRTCGELAKEGKIAPLPSKDGRLWGVSADLRVGVAAEDLATGPREKTAMPAPTPLKKKLEDKPVDVRDWRMTDFTF